MKSGMDIMKEIEAECNDTDRLYTVTITHLNGDIDTYNNIVFAIYNDNVLAIFDDECSAKYYRIKRINGWTVTKGALK